MSIKTWKPHPLDSAVAETLEKKGPLTDVDLFELLKHDYNAIGFGEFNKLLMKMEIKGKITVSTLTKGKRQISLRTNGET